MSAELLVAQHPTIAIRAEMAKHNWIAEDVAQIIGCNKGTISRILNKKTRITIQMAVNFEAAFGIPAIEILKSQNAYYLELARRQKSVDRP